MKDATPDRYDVVIIGGAVMGSATAFFLSHEQKLDGRILVLEKDNTYENAASSRSTSGFRQQFSTPTNIKLARFSADFIKDANSLLGSPGDEPGIPVTEAGYLYLGPASMVDAFVENHRVQRALGVDVALLDKAALSRRFPWLNVDDVAVGSLGLNGEGWLDGYLLMNAFRRKARNTGVEYRYREVTNLQRMENGQYRISLDDGSAVAAEHVVNTAGTFAPTLARMVGIALPVTAAKQNVFSFESEFRCDGMPYLFTPDGLFCRPEGKGFIAGIGIKEEDNDVALSDMTVDYAMFDEAVWPRLAYRVAAFESVRFKSAWAGHYDMSRFDHNPFIGTVSGVPNFYLASGFSGHGLMQSPGVGRALAELIAHGSYQTLDLSELAFARLQQNAPVHERIQY